MQPNDPVMLLGAVNTRLWDGCGCLEGLCAQENMSPEALTEKLAVIAYHYDREQNRFI